MMIYKRKYNLLALPNLLASPLPVMLILKYSPYSTDLSFRYFFMLMFTTIESFSTLYSSFLFL